LNVDQVAKRMITLISHKVAYLLGADSHLLTIMALFIRGIFEC